MGLLDGSDAALRVERITGADPVSASVSVARQSHSTGAPVIIIAGTGALADGVVATGLAGALDAPILLNEPDALSPQIRDLVRELDTEVAYLIGGVSALSEDITTTLQDNLDVGVIRVAGPSRFDTANLVADLFDQRMEPPLIDGLRSALLVPSEDVAASLEAGSLAASNASPMPVLISQSGRLPGPTVNALQRLDIEQLFVVTGEDADTSRLALGFAGEVRFIQGQTGAADMAIEIQPFRPPRVVIVPEGDEARALIAGPLAGRESGVILTAAAAESWLIVNCGTVGELFIIGEAEVITDAQVTAAENAVTNCGR